jgi:murein DD-endopeptidase MepM/ murein hydrolase activator NlpD
MREWHNRARAVLARRPARVGAALVVLAALAAAAGTLALGGDGPKAAPSARAPIQAPPSIGYEPSARGPFSYAKDRPRRERPRRQGERDRGRGEDSARGRRRRGRSPAARRKRRAEQRRHVHALAADGGHVAELLRRARERVGRLAPGSGLRWPVVGRVSSAFGPRWGRLHAGIDIAAPRGTPVAAAERGRVALLGAFGGYGNFVCILHAGELATCYAHLSRYATSADADVRQGQVIGYVGCTGHCYGYHLHFETRVDGSPVDPLRYLP